MSDELFTRGEVLGGGLSRVRRARALVFLVEQEARRIGDQRTMMATSAPESAGLLSAIHAADPETMRRALPGEADEAFIESFRNTRRRAKGAESRMLESAVDSWKVLLPDDLELRAEVLHQMSLRHGLPRNRSKRLAEAFGVGTPAFDEAYLRTIGDPVGSAFGADLGFFASLRRSSATR